MTRQTIRVLTLIESPTVTGPARNIIEFGKLGVVAEPGLPAVETMVVTYWRGAGESPVAAAARTAGLPVATILERRRWDTGVIPQLRRIIADYRPDILESRNIKSHFLVRALGLHRQYPWVAWNHGYTERDWLDRAYSQLDRWSLQAAFRVVTVCRPFAETLERRGVDGRKITILHNFVKPFVPAPAEDVEGLRRSLGVQNQAAILAVGRLSSEKGHAILLQAAARLEKMNQAPDFRVVLVGDGPEQENLQRLTARLGIGQRIVMAGFQTDVRPYYCLSTLLALPSYSEGSPNVVLEAMAAGLPIAATDAGGVPEILEDGVTGLLVQPGDPQAMAEAILRILRDKALASRLAAAARSCAESKYTPQAYRRSLTEFYLATLEAASKSAGA
ncbi:MAG: glycosyltransferase [Candidatus Korobacteraceae bacterium]